MVQNATMSMLMLGIYHLESNKCIYSDCDNILFRYFRLILKTDAEAVLKGNQWILSGYSPFKDKPCVPNLIDDQCFEEVRLMGKFDDTNPKRGQT